MQTKRIAPLSQGLNLILRKEHVRRAWFEEALQKRVMCGRKDFVKPYFEHLSTFIEECPTLRGFSWS
jgi:hypothetical protein